VLGARATRIDRLARTVEIRGHGAVRYDRLALAMGRAEQSPPGLWGAHGVASVTAVDALRDAAAIAGTAIVVGAGMVAHGAAAALGSLGPRVILVHPDALADGASPADTADLVVRALGSQPDARLASDAGLGSLEGVCADPAGRTTDPAIVATGGLLGLEDEAATEAHARSVARALMGMDAISRVDAWPPDPADATG
jgi:NAD(P)H-nitrite reductase large subunit